MSHLFGHTTIERISILGCGWLGMALAKHFIAQGFQVKGSTTSLEKIPKMREMGMTAFHITLLPEPEGDRIQEFLQSDLLIVNIPPGNKRGMPESYHPTQISNLMQFVRESTISKVIYVSSTSVYPNNMKEALESDALSPHAASSRSLLLAEDVVRNGRTYEHTIVRCGGLMGYDRVPGKYFQGQKDLTTGDVPVNFIHRDDVVGIIDAIVHQQKWGEIFNAVAPLHPARREVYLANAKLFGFDAPTFKESNEKAPFKLVSAYKVMSELNYRFKYPNPLDFPYIWTRNYTPSPDAKEIPDTF